jgi:hypothetical protein
MELGQHCTSLLMSVLFDEPARAFLEEPNTGGDDESRNDLESKGKAPCPSDELLSQTDYAGYAYIGSHCSP